MSSNSNTSSGLARRPTAPPQAQYQPRQTPPAQPQGTGTALAQRLAPPEWTRDYLQVLKDTYAKKTTDAEFALAVQVSKATGLRIDTHELWVYKRGDNEPVTITISVDGFRAIAHSSGVYAGEEGPFWCGRDGVWQDVWLDEKPPAAAKFIVWRRDFPKPFVAVILLAEFRNTSPFWKDKPVHQSGVRVATHAYRKAFRQEIGDVQNRALAEGAALGEPADATPPALATEYAPRLTDARTGEILEAEIVTSPEARASTAWPRPTARASTAAASPDLAPDRTLEIDDLPPEAEDDPGGEPDAEDVAYLEAASTHSSNRPAATAPGPIDEAPLPDPAPPVRTVQQARAAATAAAAPKGRAELLERYRQWVKRAMAAGVTYVPEAKLEDADEAQFREVATALVRAVKAGEAAQQQAGNGGAGK